MLQGGVLATTPAATLSLRLGLGVWRPERSLPMEVLFCRLRRFFLKGRFRFKGLFLKRVTAPGKAAIRFRLTLLLFHRRAIRPLLEHLRQLLFLWSAESMLEREARRR